MTQKITSKPWKRAIATGAILILTFSLAGCYLVDPNWKQERQDNLDAAVAEFQASSLGEVICEGAGGKPTPNNGYTHFFVIEGNDMGTAVATRLENLGYSGAHNPDTLAYSRSGGIGVEAYPLGFSDYTVELETSLIESGCTFPTPGSIWVEFRESPSTESSD